jgi:hypothetical protein
MKRSISQIKTSTESLPKRVEQVGVSRIEDKV